MITTNAQNEIITWTDPAGNVLNMPFLFAPAGIQVVWGMAGRGMPPIAYNERATPYQPGAGLIFSRHDVREIAIPIEIWADSITYLRTYEREIATAFDPVRGQGTLSVTLETGETRQLTCRLIKGFEWVEDVDRGYAFVARAVLVFRATDPYWYDPRTADAQTITNTGGAGGTGSGTTYTQTGTIINAGSARTWPIWTLTINNSSLNSNDGFSSSGSHNVNTYVTVRNTTTGNYFTVYVVTPNMPGIYAGTITLASTDTTRIIDTRPNKKTVVNGSSVDKLATLSYQNMFPLAPGANVISLELFVPGKYTQAASVYSTYTANAVASVVYDAGYLTL